MLPQGRCAALRHQRNLVELLGHEQAGAHAVVDVVRVVGHLVGEIAQLRLEAGLRAVDEALGHATRLGGEQAARIARGAVLQHPFARLETEVQPVVCGIALFQFVHNAKALQVVLEAVAVRLVTLEAFVERVLPSVAEGCVTQVVGQRDGFDQVFVEAQRAGDRAAELRNFERVRQPRAEQVALVVQEHLGLVDEAAERCAVHDAVAVALEFVAVGGRRLGVAAPA